MITREKTSTNYVSETRHLLQLATPRNSAGFPRNLASHRYIARCDPRLASPRPNTGPDS